MAESYHLVNESGQAVIGSEINELFEIRPSTQKLNDLNIATGGGNDTIKISDSNSVGFYATLSGWTDDGYFLNFNGTKYGTYSDPLIYRISEGSLDIFDAQSNFGMTILGKTDTVGINTNSNRYGIFLNKYSRENGGAIVGSDFGEIIEVNHSRNSVNAAGGNDTITVNSDRNTIEPYRGDDLIIVHGDNNTVAMDGYYLYTADGNDTLISDGDYNTLFDDEGNNLFISGGYRNVIRGGTGNDTVAVYAYNESGGDFSIRGGGGDDFYIISTGLVGVHGENVFNAAYNPATNETLRAIITDFDSKDSIYIRNKGMTSVKHTVGAAGIYVFDNTGKFNIVFADKYDWDSVKNAQIIFDDMNGNSGTLTLEQAENLPINPPAGINVDGNNIIVTSSFNGDLWMLDGYAATNYNNQNIINIDATQNPNTMIIAANVQSNYVKAGGGQTSLWGGADGNDTLESGGGQTMFCYGKNDGNDVFVNAHDYDTINFYDVSLDDVTSLEMNDNSFSIGFNTGNSLTVYDKNSLTPAMQIYDGSRYVYNRATNSWQI